MAGQCGGCNVFEFTPSVWASGGNVLSDDGKTAQLDSPEVTDALNFYEQMHDGGVMPDAAKTDSGTAQSALFQGGKVGMVTLGAFFSQTLNNDKGRLRHRPDSRKDGRLRILRRRRQHRSHHRVQEQSRSLGLREMGAPAMMLRPSWLTTPSFRCAPTSWRPSTRPRIPATLSSAKLLKDGKTPYSVVENKLFNDNNGPWATMINEAVFGGDVKAAQDKAQQAAQQIIQTEP